MIGYHTDYLYSLGHSSITVTLDLYSHLTDQNSEMVANSMDGIYGSERRPK